LARVGDVNGRQRETLGALDDRSEKSWRVAVEARKKTPRKAGLRSMSEGCPQWKGRRKQCLNHTSTAERKLRLRPA
jgi:hypothetical protein